MKLSDYVMDFVVRKGVKHVFVVPGGGAMHLNDSLGAESRLQFVANLHEQASAMAAETYAKATGGLGVALFTTGPGGTNAVTGVAGAWLDSTPCLFLSGQAKRPDLKRDSGVRQMGAQEVDIVSIVGPITKYAVLVLDPREIRFELEKGVHLALSGRPGPVWIDIPLDVQAAQIEVETLRPYITEAAVTNDRLPEEVARALQLLRTSERPVILLGNGVRLARAQEEFLSLASELRVPILATWLAVDLLPYDHPLYIGRPGVVAPRGCNFVLQNCDFLLAVGARLDFSISGYALPNLARAARKVIVDVDPAELRKLAKFSDVLINADAGDFLRAMRLQIRGDKLPQWSEWWKHCRRWKEAFPVVLTEHRDPTTAVSTYHLAEILSEELHEGDSIVSGSSGAGIEIFQLALRLKRGQRLFHTTALGAMGYGLPAAVGASIARGGRETVCVDGDGGFQLNIQELETVRRLQLPIKFFVLDNGGYSSIRTSQQRWFGRQMAADSRSGLTLPNLCEVAKAYGLPTVRIENQRNLRAEVRAVLQHAGPVVCNVVTRFDEARMPSLSSAQRKDGSMISKPLEDLWPFLPRDEFRANMLIQPLEESCE
jgi:acetolactate synthase-1/2/3 large subunit